VVYQPVVDLATGAVRAVEAFARLTSLTGGHPPTVRLLEVAEDAGLAAELDLYVLAAALAQQGRWQDMFGPAGPRSIVVNIAARSLDSGSFAADAQRLLAASRVSGRDVCLDFASADLPKLEARGPELGRLRDLGIRFAVDNIGPDLPSLRWLTWLPADFVKIDTARLADNGRASMEAMSTMVNISRALGLTTVAQSLERRDRAEQMHQYGCDLGQGHHFGAPVPASDLEALLLRAAHPAAAATIDLRAEPARSAAGPDHPNRPEM
jgi:EAL domain-containing protein (putative c-di-GMP-specific phosphodiesterase class I)